MNIAIPGAGSLAPADRARGVTAILGPTNTGKTHYAIDRMLGHASGIIGLPLRLLAREVYNRIVERVGASDVALITGEEKIKPRHPRYWVATVEAMPRDLDVAFVAVDEIQLAADLDRGHVFTDRLLNRRGREETLVIGAATMRRAVEQLIPGATIVSRPRLSKLTFTGERKITRLPRRSAIVAFSAEEVYAIAELIRRQRGGAAVVLGALSPRTRNAQVAMYQDGDVDYIVATDAIGMGLNLDVDHVAFAGDRKFDGWHYRRLVPAEFGQIAGRAGRYIRDGTFGTTGRCPPFDEDLVEALEEHRFDPVTMLQWRNADLDFASVATLQASLETLPAEPGLVRAPLAEDVMVLDIAARDELVQRTAKTRADVRRLWETCQIPDYRKVSPSAHAELALTIFGHVVRAGHIPDDWFSSQLSLFDRPEGDIDALSARIAQMRTFTYIANRSDWLADPEHWQGVARQVEDNLSDALHERLAQRFVDRRTSVLMRRLRENAMLEAQVTATGDVLVEEQHVGQLHGFRFTPDPQAAGEAARALNAAAQKALASEIEARANRVNEAVDEAFVLANDGNIRWLGEPVAKLAAGEKLLAPRAWVLADEHLTGPALDGVQRRLDLWLAQHIKKLLGPLLGLEDGTGTEGIARGIAFQIAEALGVLERARVADEVKSLDQTARAALRKLGVRFGAYHIYLAQLLKPAPRSLAALLWALKHGGADPTKGLDEVPHLAASGRTSFRADATVPKGLYRAAGFRVCGERAVRVDILERLADLIRPAINYRPGVTPGTPPPGAADRDGFVVTVAMTSLAGCSGEDFASILRSLGYVMDRRKGPPITVPLLAAAPTEPVSARVAAEPPAPGDDEPQPDATDEAPAGEAEAAQAAAAETGADGMAEAAGVAAELVPEVVVDATHAAADVVSSPAAESPAEEVEPEPPAAVEAAPSAADGMAAATEAEPAAVSPALLAVAPEPEPAAASEPPAASDPELSPTPAAQTPDASDQAADIPAETIAAPADAVSEAHFETAAVSSKEATHPPPVERQADRAASDEATPLVVADSEIMPLAEPASEAALPPVEPMSVAEPAEPEPASAEAAAEEEPLIEIWRPRRHHQAAPRRPDRPPRDRGAQRERFRPQPAATVDPAAAAPAAEATAPVAGEAVAPPPGEHPDRNRGDRGGRDGRRRFGERGGGGPGGRPDHAPAGGERPRDQGRGPGHQRPRPEGGRDRRDGRPGREDRGRGDRPFATTETARSGERQPDPNSPFAKLLALKAQLESKGKDGNAAPRKPGEGD